MFVDTDHDLLHQIRAGDRIALEVLYDTYSALVYSIAHQITTDIHLAQEITQDVFTKVWSHPEIYEPERGRFSSWLLTMTRNMAIDEIRKRARKSRFSLLPPLALQEISGAAYDTLSHLEHEEMAEVLKMHMSQLKKEHQDLLQLAYFKGQTLSEVATQQNLPIGTVKSRLHQALKTLKKHMAEWKEEQS